MCHEKDDFDKLQYIQLPFCYKIQACQLHRDWATNLEQCSLQIDFRVTRNEENKIEQFNILSPALQNVFQ